MAVCLLQCEKEPAQKMVRTLMGQGRVLHAPGIPDILVQDDGAGIYIASEDLIGFLNQNTIHFNETDRVYLIGRVTGILDPGQVASESDVNKYQMLHPEDH